MENSLIKETIIKKYGSTNKFVDAHYKESGISRTHLYQLVNYNINNPGVKTLERLATLLELPKEDVINDYLIGYRNERTSDKH